MNDPLFSNKVAAGILTAGIIAMLSGFIAEASVSVSYPEKKGIVIDVPEDGSAVSAPKVAVAAPVTGLIALASAETGEKVARKCVACHTFVQGGANKIGPNLYNVIGGAVARNADFSYSSALRESGVTWDYETLNQYLWKPAKAIPGNRMSFAGLSRDTDRAAIIAYLRSHADSSPALPNDIEIQAEKNRYEEKVAGN